MANVRVVTDSSFCLPADLVQEYGICIVPTHLMIEGKDYRDRIDITPAEFWAMFDNLKSMPTTSAAGSGDFANTFGDLAKSTDSIVCVTLSKALSATYSAVEQAREIVRQEHPGLTIEIIDSESTLGAMGFIVLEAARAAQAGKSLAEVVTIAHDMVPKVKYMTALDTLKYLINIGRAPKKAIIGEWLGVKPIVGIVKNTGLVESLGRVRGKQKAMHMMVDMVKDYADTSQPIHVMILYSNHIEEGEQLKEMVTARYNCAEVLMTEFSPVAAAGLGPVIGICFYS